MAEFVEYRAEGMIPELEQLEHIRLFEKREIRYGFIPIHLVYTGVVILHIAMYAGTSQQLGSSWLRFLRLCFYVLSLAVLLSNSFDTSCWVTKIAHYI
jgi:hypothetical protein